jgi:hypothetical protein
VHQKGLQDASGLLLLHKKELLRHAVVLQPTLQHAEAFDGWFRPVRDQVVVDVPLQKLEEQLELVVACWLEGAQAGDPPFGIQQEVVLPWFGVQAQLGFELVVPFQMQEMVDVAGERTWILVDSKLQRKLYWEG